MENEIDHGNEEAPYPAINVERMLSRAQGLTRYVLDNPEARIDCDLILDDVLDALELARGSFREVLQNNREERMRLIEARCDSEVRSSQDN